MSDGLRTRNFRRSGTGENNYRIGRPNSFFAVLVNPKNFQIVGFEAPPEGSSYPTEDTENGFKRIYPIGSDGSERVWTLSYSGDGAEFGAQKALEAGRLLCTEGFVINRTYTDDESRGLLESLWTNKRYSATAQGTNLLKNLFGTALFSYPKSVFTVLTAIDSITHGKPDSLTLDYFAGSGTTGHAVLKLNAEHNRDEQGAGKRKYILVEMGAYFDTVTKPRMQKVVYSDDWKDGKPQDDGVTGTNRHIIKYFKLESYEDTLNNLELTRSTDKGTLLGMSSKFNEEYLLKYMLDVESRASLLNTSDFKAPFNYKLKIATDTVGEAAEKTVDLVETFNYLIGLMVETMKWMDGFKVITGTTRLGDNVLVIWRNTDEKNDKALVDFFDKQKFGSQAPPFRRIYVNGTNTLATRKKETDTWEVNQIEPEFLARMFNEK